MSIAVGITGHVVADALAQRDGDRLAPLAALALFPFLLQHDCAVGPIGADGLANSAEEQQQKKQLQSEGWLTRGPIRSTFGGSCRFFVIDK